MRLVSCYIEQYGAIAQKEIVFDSGLTVLCEANGAGKTTLASFIKAMLYGLEPYRSNAKDFCDRRRFYPFAGGNFGGNLTFELQGHTYKIERFFGEKSDTSDTLTVYCDGTPTDRFGSDLGRELFGIDKASFERTLFVDSTEMDCAATADIGARLNRFLQGGEDVDFERAVERLDRAAAYLKKKRGADVIGKEKELIEELDEKIRNAERVRESLAQKYLAYEQASERIAQITEQITLAQTQNARHSEFAHYEYLLNEINENEQKKKALEQRYPSGIPAQGQAQEFGRLLEAERHNRAIAQRRAFSEQDEQTLALLAQRFRAGVPDEQTLLRVENDIQRLAVLRAQLDAMERESFTEEELRVLSKFDALGVGDADFESVGKRVAALAEAERAYRDEPAVQVLPASEPRAPRGRVYATLACLACLVAVLGLAVLFSQPIIGATLCAVGVFSMLCTAFLYLNRKASLQNVQTTTERENPEKQRLALAFREAELAASAALAGLGYDTRQGVSLAFFKLEQELGRYRTLQATRAHREALYHERSAEADALHAALGTFFDGFDLGGQIYINALSRLRTDIAEYRVQSARQKVAEHDRAELERKQAELRVRIEDFTRRYGVAQIEPQEILSDIAAHKALCEAIARGKEDATRYCEEKGLSERPQGAPFDIAALNAELGELQESNGILLREIEADEYTLEHAEVLQGELALARERLAAYSEKHRLLVAARELLTEAEHALKDRYVKPVKDRFLHYAAFVEQALGERVVMSGNFEVKFERNGKERSEKHLSMGQRSICALCFRLALIENMYGGEIPFLVLDDPFMALDAAHFARVSEVLRTLSDSVQILYFCCHESRAL